MPAQQFLLQGRCRAPYSTFSSAQESRRFPAEYLVFFTICRTFFVEFFFPARGNFRRRISSDTRPLRKPGGPLAVMGNHPDVNFSLQDR
ncbi:MAG: hypothetical protein C4531_15505 [Desulfurivibrio sp.]|nr:MAG: hypothetical protein C4531_15505 [Desulfurivibrio sp.]